jgi:hypothetical protein
MSRKNIISKMESVNNQIKLCVDICRKHDLDISLFNLKDDYDETQRIIDEYKSNDEEINISIKDLNTSLKYYKGVENKLLYIDELKKLTS